MVAGPERHESFFLRAIAALADTDRRVLIAGCADYGMLELVHRAFVHGRFHPTVVDRCPLPLMMCAWYGAKTGLRVQTELADLAALGASDHRTGGEFDLVVTHSLLRYFDAASRRQLFENWFRLLRPGGRVVTVTRLETGPANAAVAENAEAFGRLARQRGAEANVDIDPGRLERWAVRFASAGVGEFHEVGTIADVVAGFESAGFDVATHDVISIDGMLSGDVAVPAAARSALYAEIEAVRP